MQRLMSRRLAPWCLAGAAVVLGCLTAGHLFVLPARDSPRQDALVVILGGIYRGDRVDFTSATWPSAQTTILASEPAHCPTARIHSRSQATVVCFVADPLTTRGEARFAVEYARLHHLPSITVVTTADHVSRARLRFARCWPGPLAVVSAPDSREDVLRHLPYQAAAMVKALVWERGC